MRTSHFNARFAPVRIAFPLTAIHYSPWNVDTPLFCKADRFFSPFSTWTVQNSLDNAGVPLLPCKVFCYRWLIQQLDITIAMVRTVLTSGQPFSQVYSKGRALECAFVMLNSMGMYCHAYRKYTGSLRNTDASIIRTHSGGPMVSPIEGFHCNICLCTHVQYMSRWVCTSCLTRVYGWCGCCVQSTHTILFLSVALLPIHEYWDIQHSLSVVTVLFWVRTLSGALHTASICQWLGD